MTAAPQIGEVKERVRSVDIANNAMYYLRDFVALGNAHDRNWEHNCGEVSEINIQCGGKEIKRKK